ncbi:MAG: pyridoxal phosphate-dependent aminotransferase [Lachnospiraceae bacterium]|nr:pyridoxal phosphate-dependent aminotransferase [Lachnospiraceae bacterium]
MTYEFDKIVDRRGTNSLKWDVSEGELPMWVADMDFQVAPEIKAAILKRAEHGVFGYSIIPKEWYDAYIKWWDRRHHFRMEKDWLLFVTGVIPAISSAVRRLTAVGENVLVQTPVYNQFFTSIVNNGRNVAEAPLRYDKQNYYIDFKELEQKLADPDTTLMLLCNPHNPVGKIWDKETLAKIGELCFKHHVKVLSDEIHCDLTAPKREYVPFASASELCRNISVTCITPTKTFNLAGIQTAAIAIPDEVLRHKMQREIMIDDVAEPNAFAVDAAIAAFNEGEAWLDALRDYVDGNKRLVSTFLKENLPDIKIVHAEATYLVWLNLSTLQGSGKEIGGFLREKTGLYLTDGGLYGRGGENFLRMNLACPRSVVEDGLRRMREGIAAYKKL